MQTFDIKIGQKRRFTATVKDAPGNALPGTGAIWQVSDPNGLALSADPSSPNGQSTFIASKSTIGSYTAAAFVGPANAQVTTPFTLNVVAGDPDHIDYTADPPVAQ